MVRRGSSRLNGQQSKQKVKHAAKIFNIGLRSHSWLRFKGFVIFHR
jgi:hypothetical protein